MPLITPFDPWQNKLCRCPQKLSLSPYTGCAHGCLYCYAAGYIRGFSDPRPKVDFLARLKKELVKIDFKHQNIFIRMDRRSSMGRVMDVWDLCRALSGAQVRMIAAAED